MRYLQGEQIMCRSLGDELISQPAVVNGPVNLRSTLEPALLTTAIVLGLRWLRIARVNAPVTFICVFMVAITAHSPIPVQLRSALAPNGSCRRPVCRAGTKLRAQWGRASLGRGAQPSAAPPSLAAAQYSALSV